MLLQLLDHRERYSDLQVDPRMRHMQKAQSKGKGAENGSSTIRQARTNPSFHLLWSRLFWSSVRERRAQGYYKVWSPIHMSGYKSCSSWSRQLPGDGLLHQGPIPVTWVEYGNDKLEPWEMCSLPFWGKMASKWTMEPYEPSCVKRRQWPLTTESITSPASAEALTPNHFLTLKTKVVLPPPGVFTSADLHSRKWWGRVQHLTNELWCRWKKEFLLYLQERQKWSHLRRNLKVNDVVIVKDESIPRNQWKVCRVVQALPDEDGFVPKVRLEVSSANLTSNGKRRQSLSTLDKPIHKLVLLTTNTKDE